MRLRTLIAAGLGLVGLVVLIGWLVFEIQRIAPTAYDQPFALPDPSELQDGIDKPVAMVFSLSLGLFVMAGFVLRGLAPQQRRTPFILGTCALFLFGSMLAIYMGFLARGVALYYASFRSEASISLAGTFISLQLLGAAIAALAAILLLADFLLGKAQDDKAAP